MRRNLARHCVERLLLLLGETLLVGYLGVLAVQLQTRGFLRVRAGLLAEDFPEFPSEVYETRTFPQLKTEPLQLDGILHVLNSIHVACCGAVVGMRLTPCRQQACPSEQEA